MLKKREKTPTSNKKVRTIAPVAKGAKQQLLRSMAQVLKELKKPKKGMSPRPSIHNYLGGTVMYFRGHSVTQINTL